MSKTGAHIITKADCEELIKIAEIIEEKESYMRTEAEKLYKKWFDEYLQRLLLHQEKREEYKKRTQN